MVTTHHYVLQQAVIDEGRGVRPYFPHPRQELRRVAAHMHKSGEANRLPRAHRCAPYGYEDIIGSVINPAFCNEPATCVRLLTTSVECGPRL